MSPSAAAAEKAKPRNSPKRNLGKGTSGKFACSPPELVAYIAIYICSVACRIPEIFTHGRFWAEEGSVFYAHAWHCAWYQALFTPYGGYLNLPANIGAILARYAMPLDWAPYAPICLSLLFQTVPAVVLCMAKDSWIKHRIVLLPCLMALATAPIAQESWLTTLQSQVFLTLSCALILAFSTVNGKTEWFRRIVLLFAPLSGCTSIFLAPLFLLRAFIDRSRDRFIQAAFIIAGSLAQIYWFLIPYAGSEHTRFNGIDWKLLLSILYEKLILIPFMNSGAMKLTEAIHADYHRGDALLYPIIGSIVIFTALAMVAWRHRSSGALWLFAPALLLPALGMCFALDERTDLLFLFTGCRYALCGQMLFTFFYLYLWRTVKFPYNLIFAAAGLWIVFTSVKHYHQNWPYFTDGPSWHNQVAAWRHDPSMSVGGWPRDGWTFPLDPVLVKTLPPFMK